MAVVSENKPGVVFALPVTDGNKVKNLPPMDDRNPEDLKVDFMTREKAEEMEKKGEILTLGVGVLSPEQTKIIRDAKGVNGDLPVENLHEAKQEQR